MGFKYTVVCDTLKFIGYDVLERPQEILEAIKGAGYDGADLPCDVDRINAKELRHIVDSLGLEVPELLGAWAYFHAGENRDLAGADEEARRRGILYSKKSINLAVEMGAQFFELCAAQPPVPEVPFPKLPIKTLRQNFLGSAREICEYAADRGITILFEPLNLYEAYPGVLTTVHDAIRIIDEIRFSNTGIQPDIFHMNIGEASIPDSLRAAGKYVKHVHVNETNHYALGTGHADFKAIVTTLKEINFTGYLAIYMPLTTREIFLMTSRGYGSSSSLQEGSALTRPDLKTYLERPLKYMKQIESLVELERTIRAENSPTYAST